jgi:hypothetical protein
MQGISHYNASGYITCDVSCELTWGFRLVLFWCNFGVIGVGFALLASYKV